LSANSGKSRSLLARVEVLRQRCRRLGWPRSSGLASRCRTVGDRSGGVVSIVASRSRRGRQLVILVAVALGIGASSSG
jgi:hypothetical protein